MTIVSGSTFVWMKAVSESREASGITFGRTRPYSGPRTSTTATRSALDQRPSRLVAAYPQLPLAEVQES